MALGLSALTVRAKLPAPSLVRRAGWKSAGDMASLRVLLQLRNAVEAAYPAVASPPEQPMDIHRQDIYVLGGKSIHGRR